MKDTGQTVYEQLQEMLNKCIELGWRKGAMHKAFISCDITGIHFISRDESIEKSEHISYHDLFSKDSGLMEFVEWKEPDNQVHMILGGLEKYNYMMMGPMTAEQKVEYFIRNAILPGQKQDNIR